MEMFNDFPYNVYSDGTVTIQAGDIRADDLRNIVLALEINSGAADLDVSQLVQVQASYYNIFDNMKLENIRTVLGAKKVSSAEVPASDTEVTIERLIYSSAKTAIKAAKHISDGDTESAKTLLTNAIERIESNLRLSPDALNPFLQRLKNTANKIKEKYKKHNCNVKKK